MTCGSFSGWEAGVGVETRIPQNHENAQKRGVYPPLALVLLASTIYFEATPHYGWNLSGGTVTFIR